MADVTNGLGLRKLVASTFANNSNFYYFCTLHDSGGSALTSSTDTWTGAGMAGELATSHGYTQLGKTCGTASVNSNTSVDTPDVVWTASGGSIGPMYYAAVWVNTSNSMTGAKFVGYKDKSASPQTASDTQTMTVTIADLIQF